MSDTSRPNRSINRFFDMAADPKDTTLFQGLREPRDAKEESIHSNIDEGENPFKLWRTHYDADMESTAAALGISVKEYEGIEENIYWSDKEDVNMFCLHFRRHPVDLVSETDVMPTSIAESLIDRALDAKQVAGKRERARFAIMDEIEKSMQVFTQNRLHLGLWAGRQPDTLEAKAFTKLNLHHVFAHSLTSFRDVQNVLLEEAHPYEDLITEAEIRIPAFYNAKHRLRRQQSRMDYRLMHLWDRLSEKAHANIGEKLSQAITDKDKGVAWVRKAFMKQPEQFGAERWYSGSKQLICGKIYGWEAAAEEFFDLLSRWYSYNLVRDQWIAQRDTLSAAVTRFDQWIDKGTTQDAMQAFANVCLFNQSFGNDPEIQAKLAVFRPTRTGDATLNGVFKPAKPC